MTDVADDGRGHRRTTPRPSASPSGREPRTGLVVVGLGQQSGGLHGSVVQTLGRRIAAEDLPAGSRLRVEDLSAEFGVSRTVVRESLRALEAKRMVGARPRVGTLVLPRERWNLIDPDVITWRMAGGAADTLLLELLDLRRAVEPLAARRFALGHDEHGLRALQRSVDLMDAAVRAGDVDAFSVADAQFHRLVVAHSGNEIFGQLVDAVVGALEARRRLRLMPAQLDLEVVASHAAVVTCLAAGDAEAAEEAVRTIADVASSEIDREIHRQTNQPNQEDT